MKAIRIKITTTLPLVLWLLSLIPMDRLTAETVVVNPFDKMPLSEDWTFSLEGSHHTKPVQIAKGLVEQGYPPPTNGRYRIHFFYPEGTVFPAQGIYLNRIQEADKIYLNGVQIGGTGNFPPYGEYSPNWYYKRLYYLPDGLIKRGAQNTIEIHVFYQNKTLPGGIFRSVPEIGNLELLRGNILVEDLRDLCILMLFFGIGAYQIFAIILRKKAFAQTYLLLSSICFVFWRLPLLNITHTYSGLSFFTLLKIFFVSQTLFPAALLLFSYSIFRDPIRLKEFLLLALVFCIAAINLLPIGIADRIILLRIWEVLLLPLVFFVIRGVYRASRIFKREALLLGLGFLIVCIAGLIDILIDVTSGKNIYLTQYGFLFLMLLSAVTVSARNAINEQELSELTRDLEKRVQIRTEEINQKNYKLQEDLFFASQLQGHLLPKDPPDLHGLRLHPTYLPMEQVGGDFYDWVVIDQDRLLLFVADVAGHGVPAALVSSMVKVQFREIAKDTFRPGAVLSRMNDSLIHLVSKYYITASCALIDLKTQTITLSSAGHPNPFVYNVNVPQFQFFKVRGSILGWRESFVYPEVEESLHPGDRIIFYTDGVTEARTDGKMFGESSLIRIVQSSRNKSIQELAEAIQIEILDFSDSELKDDITYVILEIV
ncbi:PP2C family protein-serine/threonine phosphatase [Leptospira ryugenii]|uniref:PP2C family protein-serine/threonine phosphatase n=1 Tax=Leptospira ryugenii TaxID=1917863 RepID=UPI000D594C37|nr:SpoIIE family protein phosphatase [Leptospira ryugenii]